MRKAMVLVAPITRSGVTSYKSPDVGNNRLSWLTVPTLGSCAINALCQANSSQDSLRGFLPGGPEALDGLRRFDAPSRCFCAETSTNVCPTLTEDS